MLLPMLSIYQEYVRNHHYSLQVSVRYDSVICDGSIVSSVLRLIVGLHCHFYLINRLLCSMIRFPILYLKLFVTNTKHLKY